MNYESILFEVRDGIARLTFNRPDSANGMTLPMCQEMLHAATFCDNSPEVRAMIVTGAGKMFSAGGDLKSFAAFGDELPERLSEMATYLHATISRLARMRAPVITAVNGMAAGAGMSFAACGDLVLAAESAKFTMAYTAAGLSPDGSSSYFLPRLIGLRRTQELMITNRRLSAAEALEWGLVTRVVPDAELLPEADKLARTLADGPTAAYGTVKRLLAGTFAETLETQMELEGRGIVGMAHTADGREGIAAFSAKRRPVFRGA